MKDDVAEKKVKVQMNAETVAEIKKQGRSQNNLTFFCCLCCVPELGLGQRKDGWTV